MYQHMWESASPEGTSLICGTCGLRDAPADHYHTVAEETGYAAISEAMHALLMTLRDEGSQLSDLCRTRAEATVAGLLAKWSTLRAAGGCPAGDREYVERYRQAFPDDAEGIGRLEWLASAREGKLPATGS